MNSHHHRKQLLQSILAISLIVICGLGSAQAESAAITAADIKFSEPFEITASIMDIDYGKDLLIVAEREVYAVDFVIGSEAIKTLLSDSDGNEILFDDLARGQQIRVVGMTLSDGRVIAEELVLQPGRR